MRIRILIGGLLTVGLVAVAAAPAQAAPPGAEVTAKIARQQDGPYSDVVRMGLADGQAKNAYVKVKSLTGETEGAEMKSSEPSDLRLKFFNKNGVNITDDVLSGPGFSFNVKPDAPKRFRVRVKALDANVDDCVDVDVNDDPPPVTSTVSVAVNLPTGDCAP